MPSCIVFDYFMPLGQEPRGGGGGGGREFAPDGAALLLRLIMHCYHSPIYGCTLAVVRMAMFLLLAHDLLVGT